MEAAADFIRRIDRILTRGGIGIVRRAVEPGHSGMPEDASLLKQPRLIVGVEGIAVFELNVGAKTGEVALRARDALFVGPGRWVRARPRRTYGSMGVVFYAGSTRVYLMRGGPTRDDRPGKPSETWIIQQGAGDEIRGLLAALGGRLPAAGGDRYARNAVESLLIAIRELLARPPEVIEGGKARFTWQAACDFVMENLHRPLSRKDVARFVRVHPNHLSRLFTEFGSGSFTDFLLARRLERARLLMEDPRLNISEVARLSGFASGNYFARVFRAQTSRTPTRARRAGRATQSRQASPK